MPHSFITVPASFFFLLHIYEVPDSDPGPEIGYPNWGFYAFPQSLQANAEIVQTRSILSNSFFTIMLSFDGVQSELLNASLNKRESIIIGIVIN
jgi:hypothetical protein